MENLIHMNYMQSYYKEKINIAIIGAGRAGLFHLHSLLSISHFNLKYIIDLDINKAQNLVKIYGDECFASDNLNLVLEDKNINAVIIATNTNTHYNLSSLFLQYGKNVLCEKPLPNVEECFELADKNKCKLLIGYHKRFDLDYQELIKKISKFKGSIINIKSILKDNCMPSINYLKTSNGIVNDMLTHDIDIINLIMGHKEPIKIIALKSTLNKELKKIDEIENIEVILQYDEGELVTITSSRNANYGYDHRMEVVGDFGLLKLDNLSKNNVIYCNNNNIEQAPIKYNFNERFKDAYLNELNYFYNMICNNYPNIITPQSIKLNNKICDLINKSLVEDKIIYNNLRSYSENSKVHQFYKEQHLIQTYDNVTHKIKNYKKLNKLEMTMSKALSLLDNFIDPSDPDLDLPNSIHAYQTAERIRKERPLDYELQITGLIHDIGKVLFKYGEKSTSVVGDTFILGCKFPETIIYYESLKDNPDFNNENYQSELGIYKKNCGLENVVVSFGHDEYLYLVLKLNNNHNLSDKYLNIIRFHSLYPWHTGKSYKNLMNDNDYKMLEDVLDFNQFDLYSKEDTKFVLTNEIKKYYENLLEKYFPNPLKW